jgi:hypothetical protein
MSRTDPAVPSTLAEAAMPTPLWLSRLAIIVAGLLWSSSGLFGKLAIFDDWPIEQRGLLLSFWRATFAALFLWPFVRRPHWRWELLPMGVLLCGDGRQFHELDDLGNERQRYLAAIHRPVLGAVDFALRFP